MQDLIRAGNILDDISSGKTEYSTNLVNEASEIYKKVCFDKNVEVKVRARAFVEYVWSLPKDGLDALRKLRDMIMYAPTQTAKLKLCDILKNTLFNIEFPEIDNNDHIRQRQQHIEERNELSYELLLATIQLHNLGELNVYHIFKKILDEDISLPVMHQLEACKYLVASLDYDYKKIASDRLKIFLSSSRSQTTKERYEYITPYLSRSGIPTVLNNNRIKVPYDEEFVYGLESTFFWDKGNDMMYRCLSAQILLGMNEEICPREEKVNVCRVLLDVALDSSLSENTRADAADVVLRMGVDDTPMQARRIIKDLGYSSVNRSAPKILERIKHVYNNTQNIHMIPDECVETFCDKLMSDTTLRTRPFDEIAQEVNDLLSMKCDSPLTKFSAQNSLHRIAIDTATFSRHNLTSQEILVYVFAKIQTQTGDMRTTLENMFVEELISMDGWCSTGHADRLILALQPIEDYIRFDYGEQIISNFSARMAARIEHLDDENLKGSIAMGMLPNADEEDKSAYESFFKVESGTIENELRQEFVGGGYTTESEFDKVIHDAKQRWVF